MTSPSAMSLRLPVDLLIRVGTSARQVAVRLEQDESGRLLLRRLGDSGRHETVARFTPATGDIEIAGTLSQGVTF